MFTRSMAAACLLAVAGSAAMAQELVDNPNYQSWSKFKPGTTVTWTVESNQAGIARTLNATFKLAALTPEKASLEITMSPGEKTTKLELVAKVKKEDVNGPETPPPGVKGETKLLGVEDVTVAGKTYRCKVSQFTGESGGTTFSTKRWWSPEVPGQEVKKEEQFGGVTKVTVTTLLTAVDVK